MHKDSSPLRATSGLIMLIGLFTVLVLGAFWPWIIVVLGVASLPRAWRRGGERGAIGAGLLIGLLVALALIIEAGVFWPGIIVWLIALIVLRAVIVRLFAR